LIALIAKARIFVRQSIGKSFDNARLGLKRPVLLQTHPGI
jgi:hypothetical protein